jgi:hypothetical protein
MGDAVQRPVSIRTMEAERHFYRVCGRFFENLLFTQHNGVFIVNSSKNTP